MEQDKQKIASGESSDAQAVDRIQHPFVGLSIRAANVLKLAGIKSKKEFLIYIEYGAHESKILRYRNCGIKTLGELMSWSGCAVKKGPPGWLLRRIEKHNEYWVKYGYEVRPIGFTPITPNPVVTVPPLVADKVDDVVRLQN